jgi:FkbM family methyltransferase
MNAATLIPANKEILDLDLLRLLRGRSLSSKLRSMYVIGAHRLDEKALLDEIFPNLRHLCVFEPLDEPRALLSEVARKDPRMRVLPFAISDFDGKSQFLVSNNDGESSSLLPFGTHTELFPHVQVSASIEVDVRRLSTVIAEKGLPPPDGLLIDVQGAEYAVLSGIDDEILKNIRLIYSEVSTEPVYQGSKTLSEICDLLASQFHCLGYAALTAHTPTHGNAIFARHADVRQAVRRTLRSLISSLG